MSYRVSGYRNEPWFIGKKPEIGDMESYYINKKYDEMIFFDFISKVEARPFKNNKIAFLVGKIELK